MTANAKSRNSSIDLLKLLFAITVVLFHFGGRQGVNMVTGGYLVVEGFFMITGYFMMNSASKARENDIARDTVRFISRKYSSIFLPLLFSVIISFSVTAIYKNYALKELPFEIIYMLSEILPLQITGMHTLASTGVSWYLSAMLLALLILYPIARTAGKKFSKIICPILVFVIYGSLCLKFKQLNIITDLYYELPIRVGLLRGIAGICTGCMIYECVKATEKHKLTRLGEICFLVAEIVCVVFITVTICSHAKQVTDFFTLPFFFVLIYSFFGRKSLFSKNFSFDFTKHLGSASLLIYLNHNYWNYFLAFYLVKLYPDMSTAFKFAFYVMMITASCILVQLLSVITERLKEKFKPSFKKNFIGE